VPRRPLDVDLAVGRVSRQLAGHVSYLDITVRRRRTSHPNAVGNRRLEVKFRVGTEQERDVLLLRFDRETSVVATGLDRQRLEGVLGGAAL